MKKKWNIVGMAAACGIAAITFHAYAADKLKIGFIYVGPIGDLGWSYQHDLGRKQIEKELGDKVGETTYLENVPEGADAERSIEQLARTGHKLIFTTSFGFMDATLKVANKYPNVFFEHATGFKRAFVLDFRNEEEDIFKAFKPYYETTPIGENADPQKLNELHHKLLQPAIFTPQDVTEFAARVWFKARRDPSGQDHKQINAILDRCVARFMEHEEAAQEEFRGLLIAFRNLYGFLSQILPYFDDELERLYAFVRHLVSNCPTPVAVPSSRLMMK